MEEQPKRGRGRPKKVVTEPEVKRKVGRPKKEKTEETPKRPRGRPKKQETEKILLTETRPVEVSTPAGGKPAPPPSPAPPPVVLAKPIVVETAPPLSEPDPLALFNELTLAERHEWDRFHTLPLRYTKFQRAEARRAWEERERAKIDVTLPSPPDTDVELPSDPEEARAIVDRVDAMIKAKQERQRRRVEDTERKRIEERDRKERQLREERERSIAETGWADPEYVKFRRSFKTEEAYDRWEERVIHSAMYETRDPVVLRFATHRGRRWVVVWKLNKPEDKMVVSADWKNASIGKNPDAGGGAILGYVGSGEFRDLVLPP